MARPTPVSVSVGQVDSASVGCAMKLPGLAKQLGTERLDLLGR